MTTQEPQTSIGTLLYETASLFAVVAFYGPPILLLATPWLLFAILLSAPFVLAVLVVATLSATTALIALLATLLRRVTA